MITPEFHDFLGQNIIVVSGTLLVTLLYIIVFHHKPWIRIFWWTWMILSGGYCAMLLTSALSIPDGPDGGWVAMGFMFILLKSLPIVIFFVLLWIFLPLLNKQQYPKTTLGRELTIISSYLLIVAITVVTSIAFTRHMERRWIVAIPLTLFNIDSIPLHDAQLTCTKYCDLMQDPWNLISDEHGNVSVEVDGSFPTDVVITRKGYRSVFLRLEPRLLWVSWIQRDGKKSVAHHLDREIPNKGLVIYLPREFDSDDLPYKFGYIACTADNLSSMLFNNDRRDRFPYWDPIQLDVESVSDEALKQRIITYRQRNAAFCTRISEKDLTSEWRRDEIMAVERTIVSLIIAEGIEIVAADFARSMVSSHMGGAQFAESYLQNNPETHLKPYLLLFLLHEDKERARHGGDRIPGEKRDAMIRQIEQYHDPLVTLVGKALAH